MPKVKSVFVIDYYEGIRGLLSSRENFPFKEFFANPRLRTQKEITWSSDLFTEKPILLKDLQGTLKERYSLALKERIEAVEILITNLKEEGETALGDLLSKAVSFIDESFVYCGEDKVIVVNWGLIPRRPDLVSGSIYRSGKFVGIWTNLHPNSDVIVHKNQLRKQQEIPKSQELTSLPPVEDVETNTSIVNEPQNINNNHVINSSVEEPSINASAEQPTSPILEQKPIEEEKHEESTTVERSYRKTEEKHQYEQKRNTNDYTWKICLLSLWKGLKFFLHKIWLLLLLLLLVFLVLFLCRGCQGLIHHINPFYNPLPENPRVLPIERNEVGMSADGMTQIATDRLNILLEKKDENTMLEWAKAFKKAYDGDEYEIYYYNKDLYNLQIKIPASERERIKRELPEKLNGFSFEVFDEHLYNSQFVSFNDPELKNDSHSWYLNAIGAQDAWTVTLGDPNVVVAVVDDGFDTSHPELTGKIVYPYNVLTQDANVRPIITKEGVDAHGTHVAATAVGNCNNGTGLMGIAPKCRLMLVQVGNDNPEGVMSGQAIIEGVMYAINQGADVINVSLGMDASVLVRKMSEGQQLNYISSSFKQEELLWNKIFQMAKNHNCTVVFAAGNENIISGIDPQKRNCDAIRVSAVNTSLAKANFSNYGVYPQLNRYYSTISAPGVNIYSAAPGNHYVSMDGTSMAAPIVSGTVALMKSIDKSLTTSQIVTILQQTGRSVGNNIGPLLQLRKAILAAKGERIINDNCEEIADEVKRLRTKIDSLCQLCPDAEAPEDTLKYKDATKNRHGLDGLWKTTTNLVSTADNSPIELYMQFRNLSGVLTIVNKNDRYTAPLTASVKNGKITITQHQKASNGISSFSIYEYVCFADSKGNLTCTATSEQNTVTSNLIREK